MKRWRIVIALLLCLALTGTIACNSWGGDSGTEEGRRLVTVERGDLTVSSSGSGNVEVSNEARVAFGVGGKVDKIYVEEGDQVSKGDKLAKLDTSDLELNLTQAEAAYNQAEAAVTQAEVAVTQAQVAITQAEVAITQAEVALQTAEYNLDVDKETYTLADIKAAITAVDEAETNMEDTLSKLSEYPSGSTGAEWWQKAVVQAQSRLKTAEDRLDAILMGYDTEEVAIKKLQVQAAEESLVLAEQSLALAQQSLGLAQLNLKLNQQSVEPARQVVAQARKQLDEATLTAPIDGVVADVYADEEDIIPSPSVGPKIIVHIIDLTSMELRIDVDEIDIPLVKLNQKAIINFDALPSLQLEGKVTYISPVPKIEAGVVLYRVTIDVDVLEGSGVRVGMSATADVVIDSKTNILLVPSRAIDSDSQGNPVVMVMVNEQIGERAVVTGISDSLQTEIVSGLQEGEIVVIESRAK